MNLLYKKDLGNLVKKAREYKSKKINMPFTQKMLSDQIGKSRSYICDIERGRTSPSFATLSDISKACDVPLDFFQNNDDINESLDKFIKLQLTDLSESEVVNIREALKKDDALKIDYMYKYINNHSLILEKEEEENKTNIESQFKNAEDLIKYILETQSVLDFYKIKKENSKEFADAVLYQLEAISYKYRE